MSIFLQVSSRSRFRDGAPDIQTCGSRVTASPIRVTISLSIATGVAKFSRANPSNPRQRSRRNSAQPWPDPGELSGLTRQFQRPAIEPGQICRLRHPHRHARNVAASAPPANRGSPVIARESHPATAAVIPRCYRGINPGHPRRAKQPRRMRFSNLSLEPGRPNA